MTIFDAINESEVEKKIRDIDISNLTPLAALNLLAELKDLC
jgi:cell division protein ZapA (FtsZ GTPase activity inhibitor)